MAEDEDLRIEALRQELMKELSTVENNVNRDLDIIKTNIRVLKWLFGGMIAVFSLIATILAFAAGVL